MTMIATDTYVRARISSATKARATNALDAMGLSMSDAIRLLVNRIADEQRLPFDIKVPNAATQQAIAELESGKVKRLKRLNSIEALMADMHADD
jgi:DNA-damage-inducible protein J